jgi:hypothetical protein
MTTLHQSYRKSPQIVSREIAGEMILVPVSQKAGEIRGSIFTLNETAARAWKLLEGGNSVDEIRMVLSSEFEIDEEQAGQDLLELFAQLEEIGAIDAIPASPKAGN